MISPEERKKRYGLQRMFARNIRGLENGEMVENV